ncbi:MAG: hypothetical protein IT270_03100 [Saprospiraceae bacterium]|nr:hypothetical protein [Saprospiraceae bacterium]
MRQLYTFQAYLFYLMLFLLPAASNAQENSNNTFRAVDSAVPARANKELQVYCYFYTQGVAANWFPKNDFLKGQIVGRLYGANTTTTSDSLTAYYAEQRAIPFFVYQPKIFDGKATLRASFEIDWTWGDAAYGSGGNFGSAISADQVNLQTQNLEMEYRPAKYWSVNIGLQRLYDTPHDLYRTLFDKFATTGYRLAYWGTDGVGISVRRESDYTKLKAGYYKLYENNVELKDDVTLVELTGQQNLGDTWNVGASAYWVSDNSSGKGGVSILGQGLPSILTSYNGAYRFPLGADPYRADIVWLGGFFSRNEDFMRDRFLLSGFVNYNLGTVEQRPESGGSYRKTVDISGLSANLRGGYRYGQTPGDAITADVIFTTGDSDGLADGTYNGVITGNTWGTPAGIYIGHGGYMLFPHGNVVNRYVSAVSDISNIGYGIAGGTLNLAKDIIPNKLHSKIGTAFAFSPVAPNGGGNVLGVEGNAKVVYDLGAFMSIEGHAAYLSQGDFFDAPSVNGDSATRPTNPWIAFLCFRWLIF